MKKQTDTDSRPDILTIPYPEFVKALIKPGGDILRGCDASRMNALHMAVGISGEAAELLEAFLYPKGGRNTPDYENIVEELGDLEFYMEGLRQEFGLSAAAIDAAVAIEDVVSLMRKTVGYVHSLGEVAAQFAVVDAGRILDEIKRYAVYQTPGVDPRVLAKLLGMLKHHLYCLRFDLDIAYAEVIEANKRKLAKRYEKLTYSDAAAHARADKT